MKWRDLSQKERDFWTMNFSNGCGPDGPLAEFIPEINFHDACNMHDFLFWRGGTEADRRDANAQFYAAMLGAINKLQFWRRPINFVLAAWYFLNVEFFGKAFFPYSERAKTKEEFIEYLKTKGYEESEEK